MTPRQWMQRLGSRCASTMSAEESAATLADWSKSLADMPPHAFCEQSFEDASRQFEYFPAYAALRKFLDQWWRANKPTGSSLPGSDDSSLTRENQLQLAVWQKMRLEGFTHITGPHEARLKVSLGVLRRHNPRIFAHLCRTDVEIAGLAVRQGWVNEDEGMPMDDRLRADWRSITREGLARKVAETNKTAAMGHTRLGQQQLDMLRAAIGRYVPEMLSLVPETVTVAETAPGDPLAGLGTLGKVAEQVRAGMAQATAQQPPLTRPLGALTPEQLKAMRDADPSVQRARAHQELESMNAGADAPPPREPIVDREPAHAEAEPEPWVPSWERNDC